MSREAAGVTVPREPARLRDELAKTRDELRALAEERTTIERAGVPLAEARARAMAAVDAVGEGWAFDVGRFFVSDYDKEREDGHGLVPYTFDTPGFQAFVTSLLADHVKARLLPLLEREAHGRELLLPPAERAKRLAAVDRKARASAVREELLVLSLEAANVETLRRENAEPEIVLTTTIETATT